MALDYSCKQEHEKRQTMCCSQWFL